MTSKAYKFAPYLSAVAVAWGNSRKLFSTILHALIRTSDYLLWVEHSKSKPTDDKVSMRGAWSLSRDLFNFWKITTLSRKRYKIAS